MQNHLKLSLSKLSENNDSFNEAINISRSRLRIGLLIAFALIAPPIGCIGDDDDSAESYSYNCSDGEDNDGDGLIDYEDPECDCPSGTCNRAGILDMCEGEEGYQGEACDCPEEADPYWTCATE